MPEVRIEISKDINDLVGEAGKAIYIETLGILHNQPRVVYTFRGTITPSVRSVRLAISS